MANRRVHAFAHRDPDQLAEQIAASVKPARRVLVVSDGVFPVLGTVAPVGEYMDVLVRYPGSAILLDDAHAIGVLGAEGRGTWEWAGHPPSHVNVAGVSHAKIALYACATLSKACGGYGGIVAGKSSLIERLQSGRTCYGGATPLPAPVAAATAKALEIVATQPELRDKLHANARRLREGLRSLGLTVDDAPTSIVCLQLGDARQMQHLQQELMHSGIVIAYFASYSGVGPAGALRIAVFATHTSEMIDRLVDQMGRLV
jgi:7-keto-8-aminopelargonate synthetase-like enzyme